MENKIIVRKYEEKDLPAMIRIWNEVVEDGVAFPQEECLDEKTGVAQGKVHGFRVLQFNAVVAGNVHARHLYERVGFRQLGVIPGGFRLKNGEYEDICPYYIELINTVDK